MDDMVRWLPVVGYEGIYEVSEYGNVRRVAASGGARVGYILTPSTTERGYLYHRLSRGGRTKNLKVHRLVLEAFVGPSRGRFGLHYDDDPTNNHVSNLRWGTPAENGEDRHRNGLDRRNNNLPWDGRAEKGACRNGHEYSPENTAIGKGSWSGLPVRRCRECRRQSYLNRKEEARTMSDPGADDIAAYDPEVFYTPAKRRA